jgi:hypothetical protein
MCSALAHVRFTLKTGREDARIEPAMTAATNAYADLAKVKPFWR